MSARASSLLALVPRYWAFRSTGRPRTLPVNFTLSVLFACNSRCLTCNVYERKVRSFSVDEYDRFLATVGRVPYWFTLSGGEPFLRKDLLEIVRVVYDRCRPKILNIPHNGTFPDTTPERVDRMCEAAPESRIIINVSLDHLGRRHDELRGTKDNYELAVRTIDGLKALKRRNLTVGIHTVISRYNVADFPRVHDGLQALRPDSYITEVAEERNELQTVGTGITPGAEQYGRAIDYMEEAASRRRYRGIGRITQAFRHEYYRLARRTLRERRQVIPCYAGWASCHVAPDGDVWPCCVRGESVGNLRENDYDFPSIWFGGRMKEMRRSIRDGECACPLANASYTNILMSPRSLARVGANLLVG